MFRFQTLVSLLKKDVITVEKRWNFLFWRAKLHCMSVDKFWFRIAYVYKKKESRTLKNSPLRKSPKRRIFKCATFSFYKFDVLLVCASPKPGCAPLCTFWIAYSWKTVYQGKYSSENYNATNFMINICSCCKEKMLFACRPSMDRIDPHHQGKSELKNKANSWVWIQFNIFQLDEGVNGFARV